MGLSVKTNSAVSMSAGNTTNIVAAQVAVIVNNAKQQLLSFQEQMAATLQNMETILNAAIKKAEATMWQGIGQIAGGSVAIAGEGVSMTSSAYRSSELTSIDTQLSRVDQFEAGMQGSADRTLAQMSPNPISSPAAPVPSAVTQNPASSGSPANASPGGAAPTPQPAIDPAIAQANEAFKAKFEATVNIDEKAAMFADDKIDFGKQGSTMDTPANRAAIDKVRENLHRKYQNIQADIRTWEQRGTNASTASKSVVEGSTATQSANAQREEGAWNASQALAQMMLQFVKQVQDLTTSAMQTAMQSLSQYLNQQLQLSQTSHPG